MPTPLEMLRQRNAAQGKPAQVTPGQKGGIAATTIALILSATYAVEGGFVNDPSDHGGATIYGVTEQVARADGYTGDMRNFPKHCAASVPTCADKIYIERYIEAPGYTPLLTIDPPVSREVVDTAVNAGPSRSSIFLQASINVLCGTKLKTDGRVGPATISAYSACQERLGKAPFCVTMLNALDGSQERFYRKLATRPGQAKFLKGWLRARIGNVPRKDCYAF